MERETFEQLLDAWLAGELPENQREAFQCALDANPEWRREAEAQANLDALFARIETPPAPRSLKHRILAEITEEPKTDPFWQQFFMIFSRRPVQALAMMLLLIVTSVGILHRLDHLSPLVVAPEKPVLQHEEEAAIMDEASPQQARSTRYDSAPVPATDARSERSAGVLRQNAAIGSGFGETLAAEENRRAPQRMRKGIENIAGLRPAEQKSEDLEFSEYNLSAHPERPSPPQAQPSDRYFGAIYLGVKDQLSSPARSAEPISPPTLPDILSGDTDTGEDMTGSRLSWVEAEQMAEEFTLDVRLNRAWKYSQIPNLAEIRDIVDFTPPDMTQEDSDYARSLSAALQKAGIQAQWQRIDPIPAKGHMIYSNWGGGTGFATISRLLFSVSCTIEPDQMAFFLKVIDEQGYDLSFATRPAVSEPPKE
ncbi:hypothetical protein HQ520_07405, partial [bacterium]|nr:hypothetical protein [bacterium]